MLVVAEVPDRAVRGRCGNRRGPGAAGAAELEAVLEGPPGLPVAIVYEVLVGRVVGLVADDVEKGPGDLRR